jgi:hypothetical protein
VCIRIPLEVLEYTQSAAAVCTHSSTKFSKNSRSTGVSKGKFWDLIHPWRLLGRDHRAAMAVRYENRLFDTVPKSIPVLVSNCHSGAEIQL